MTALTQFQRLEATGLWRPDTEAQRREVIVSLGDATLTMSSTAGEILAHWSLGAIARANGTQLPAIYHPEGAPEETLELAADETEMITGLDRLLKAIERRRPRPGKLRFLLSGAAVAALVAAVLFWLPDALVRYATTVVPPVKRAEIGTRLLGEITRLTGQPCLSPEALVPLERFAERVGASGGITILPGGTFDTVHLPGRMVLMNRRLFEDHDDPDVAAGFALVEAHRAAIADPLGELLHEAGLVASLRLLTTGAMPEHALQTYAEDLMTRPAPPVDAVALLPVFATAELRSTPYGQAQGVSGPLVKDDPRAQSGSRAVLSDADWVRLQAICGG